MTTALYFLPSVVAMIALLWLARDIHVKQAAREAERIAAMRRKGLVTVTFTIDTRPFVEAMSRMTVSLALMTRQLNELMAKNPEVRGLINAKIQSDRGARS